MKAEPTDFKPTNFEKRAIEQLIECQIQFGVKAIKEFVDRVSDAIGPNGKITIRRLPSTGDYSISVCDGPYGKVMKKVREESLVRAFGRIIDLSDSGEGVEQRERQRKENEREQNSGTEWCNPNGQPTDFTEAKA